MNTWFRFMFGCRGKILLAKPMLSSRGQAGTTNHAVKNFTTFSKHCVWTIICKKSMKHFSDEMELLWCEPFLALTTVHCSLFCFHSSLFPCVFVVPLHIWSAALIQWIFDAAVTFQAVIFWEIFHWSCPSRVIVHCSTVASFEHHTVYTYNQMCTYVCI